MKKKIYLTLKTTTITLSISIFLIFMFIVFNEGEKKYMETELIYF